MTKEAIITATRDAFHQLAKLGNGFNESAFFKKTGARWSAAENFKHLILSTNTSTLAYKLPRFIVQLIGGNPNRPSRSYDEVLAKYNGKLEAGGKASARYVPKDNEIKNGKDAILKKWNSSGEGFLSALAKNRTEADLDNYLVRHPLLGPITLRELCYFTIFHTLHHVDTLKKMSS